MVVNLPATPVFHRLVPDSPAAALLDLLAGGILMLVEVHRPGRVLPGAVGLLLGLLGVWGITKAGVSTAGILLLGGGLVLLLWHALRRRGPAMPGWAGAVLLAAGLALLPEAAGRGIRLLGGLCGLLLGGASAWLGGVAARARHSKQAHAGASAEAQFHGTAEQWEPRQRVD